MYFVIGLGNPGTRYQDTRHNAGFLAVEELARRWDFSAGKSQFGGLVQSGSIRSEKTLLLRPQQFMNRSGLPVQSAVAYYKGQTDHLIVVHDDVDLDMGTIRVKSGGGSGGHKGLRDIDQHLGVPDYVRVRVGVGRPPEGWDTADYVLGRWSEEDRSLLPSVISSAADAVELILSRGVLDAQNTYNTRNRSEEAPTDEPSSLHSHADALSALGV